MVKLALNRTLSGSDDWNHSANDYAAFAAEKNLYRDSAGAMVRLAGIEPGMTVVDLGCGSGIVTESILKEEGAEGVRIIAVDFSTEMLANARRRITSPNVHFHYERAEKLSHLLDEKVDRVLCNAAFWHFDKEKVYAEIGKVLKPNGKCFIGVPVQDFRIFDIYKVYDEHRVIWMILEEKALRGYVGIRPADIKERHSKGLDKGEVLGYLSNHKLKLDRVESVSIVLSPKDHIDFLRIPIMVKNSYFFKGVPEKEIQEILDVVENQLEWMSPPVPPITWQIYILEPTD